MRRSGCTEGGNGEVDVMDDQNEQREPSRRVRIQRNLQKNADKRDARIRELETDANALRRQLSGAADAMRDAATLLEDVGTDDYVNPPTAEAMQRAAAQLRTLIGGR